MSSKNRILIISNNPLSTTLNNGKTILSLFRRIPADDVFQLFFSDENPTIQIASYYRLSDHDILKSVLSKHSAGEILNIKGSVISSNAPSNHHSHSNLARLLRELLWLGTWNSTKLVSWIKSINPTHLFFVGGDCWFSYRIFNTIKKLTVSRSAIYFTDDYCFRDSGLFGFIRRKVLKQIIQDTVKSTDEFFTISTLMQEKYNKIFGFDSMIIYNIINQPNIQSFPQTNGNVMSLVYAGSLYFGRNKSIAILCKYIEEYNKNHLTKLDLLIFGNYSEKEVCLFKKFPFVKLGGLLQENELFRSYLSANFLVFCESFNSRFISNVRYSFSTKIPEYMSLNKPIISVGPSSAASIDYLRGISFQITDSRSCYEDFSKFIDSKETHEKYAKRALEKFIKNHNTNTMLDNFYKKMNIEVDLI